MPNARNEMYPPAVVVELGINGLGIIRSLGVKGIPVIGIDSKLPNYGGLSKYCKTVFCKNVNDRHLVETLLSIGEGLKEKGVLFCSSDLSLLVLSKYREELQKFFLFVLPNEKVIETLMNKRLFYEFAVNHHFTVPKTFFTHNRKEVQKTAYLVSYPCVIKPEIRDSFWYHHVHNDKVLFAQSRGEYFKLINKYKISNRHLIVQEWIHGNDDDVFFCLTYIGRDAKPMAVFTGKKIRQYPPLTGVTSAAESLWHPFVAEEALRLLVLAGCRGICSVEFKYCHKENIFKITEPTVGRTDLQEAISTESGLNIPYIAYRDAIGYGQKASKRFEQGIKWINEPLEFYSVQRYLRKNIFNFKTLLSSYQGKRKYALLATHDLAPFLFFVRQKLKRLADMIRKRKLLKNNLY
jgi:predicted ATP-grasp superfamily ATP-dependent carboligase